MQEDELRSMDVNLSPTAATSSAPDDAWARLESLYRATKVDLFGYVATLLRDASAAEDVTALAFERAYRRRRTFDRKRGEERAWLFGIAANLAKWWWRQQTQWPVSLDALEAEYPDVAWERLTGPVWSEEVVEEAEQLVRGEGAGLGEPTGIEQTPDEVVPAHLHLVLLGKRHHFVPGAEFELVLSGPDRRPLHGVFRLNQIELARQRGRVGSLREPGGINRGADRFSQPVGFLPQCPVRR